MSHPGMISDGYPNRLLRMEKTRGARKTEPGAKAWTLILLESSLFRRASQIDCIPYLKLVRL